MIALIKAAAVDLIVAYFNEGPHSLVQSTFAKAGPKNINSGSLSKR
jgi:hypothetical protein